MHTQLVSKSGWHQLLTCIIIVALFLSGCAKSRPPPQPPSEELHSQKEDSRPPPLPPTPSEELRSQLGKIRISEGSEQLEMVVSKQVTNRGEGAAKGAVMGVGDSLIVALGLFPFGIVLAPVVVVMDTVKAVQESQPEAKVKEFEETFKATIQELNVPETLRQRVVERIRRLKLSEVSGPSDQTAPIIMEIVVKKIELYRGVWFGPFDLRITERTRLIRTADGVELYSHSLRNKSTGYTGHSFSIDIWLAEDASKLRQEVDFILHELAEEIVDETFFLVRLEEKEEKSNSLKRNLDEPGNL